MNCISSAWQVQFRKEQFQGTVYSVSINRAVAQYYICYKERYNIIIDYLMKGEHFCDTLKMWSGFKNQRNQLIEIFHTHTHTLRYHPGDDIPYCPTQSRELPYWLQGANEATLWLPPIPQWPYQAEHTHGTQINYTAFSPGC